MGHGVEENNHKNFEKSWMFKKNCSFTPKQVGLFYIAQSTFSLLVAGFFLLQGIWQILPFTFLELFVLAIALLIYARHATDYESIVIHSNELIIETSMAGKSQTFQWNPNWVRLNRMLSKNKLIEMSYQGYRIEIGRFMHVSLRENFLKDLQQSLRHFS
jgi:uncharacterized membrane protein